MDETPLLSSVSSFIVASPGPTGAVGPTGSTGPIGAAGVIGSTGPIGATGTFAVGASGNIILLNGHLKSNQTSSPTISLSSNLGTGSTGSILSATDVAGVLTLTTGALSIAAGIEASIVFAQAYSLAPVVLITPTNSAAALFTGGAFIGASISGFNINFAVAGAALTTYNWNYFVIETQ